MDLTKLYDHESPPKTETASPVSAAVPEVKTKRTSKEYKFLFYFLLQKFENADWKSKKLKDDQDHCEKLVKFLQLRNFMLVDLLKYIDQNEELSPLSPLSRRREAEILKRIVNSRQELASVLKPLMELPDNESLKDPAVLKKSVESLHLRDELNHELYMLESNSMPDMYLDSDYNDLFDRVKRNRFYVHDTLRYADPKRKMTDLDDLETEVEPQRRKRRSALKKEKETISEDLATAAGTSGVTSLHSQSPEAAHSVVLKFTNKQKLNDVMESSMLNEESLQEKEEDKPLQSQQISP
ncbi:hypothetical protein FOA43_000226 [Brettanomyces nanus]|uniref:Uncharacterized protein n=1 Tax=Eeniella nana TaxID=13502 RepID=A0A875RYC9_EENNA|nr:uncharacterized protein FOA43_000226 [Brettanomyces nanus]QPG72922.1 hypothetical protein FOA43_000226 [Brettanomyces nanus]